MEEQNNHKKLIDPLKPLEIKDEKWRKVVKGFTEDSFNTSPNDCTHKRQRGSDTGTSCIDCNTIILGFGVDGQSSVCLKHEFLVATDEKDTPINATCIYCGASWAILTNIQISSN